MQSKCITGFHNLIYIYNCLYIQNIDLNQFMAARMASHLERSPRMRKVVQIPSAAEISR